VAVKEEGIDIWKKVNEDMRKNNQMVKITLKYLDIKNLTEWTTLVNGERFMGPN